MRRLLSVLVAMMVLSQIPQVSAAFEEEKQGIEAAYGKMTTVYKGASAAYNKTHEDIKVVQGRLAKTKKDIDKSMVYADRASAEVSKYYQGLKDLTGVGSNSEK